MASMTTLAQAMSRRRRKPPISPLIPGYGQYTGERARRAYGGAPAPVYHDGSGGAWARPVFQKRRGRRPTRSNPGSAYNRNPRWN